MIKLSVMNHFTGDAVVELGPKWIHGVLGNPLYEFAVAQGLVGLNDQKSAEHNIVAATENGCQVRVVPPASTSLIDHSNEFSAEFPLRTLHSLL